MDIFYPNCAEKRRFCSFCFQLSHLSQIAYFWGHNYSYTDSSYHTSCRSHGNADANTIYDNNYF